MTPEEFIEKWCPAKMVDRLNENLDELKKGFAIDFYDTLHDVVEKEGKNGS